MYKATLRRPIPNIFVQLHFQFGTACFDRFNTNLYNKSLLPAILLYSGGFLKFLRIEISDGSGFFCRPESLLDQNLQITYVGYLSVELS